MIASGRLFSGLRRNLGKASVAMVLSPAGPVAIIVSLPGQRIYVDRNGVRIGVSTVSTGTKSQATPTGIFTILQKKVTHEANLCKGARMAHMQRLRWSRSKRNRSNQASRPESSYRE